MNSTQASARIADLVLRLSRRLGRVPLSVVTGTVLGLMSRAQLHALDRLYYGRARMYHDDQYNLSGLMSWELEALDGWFRECRTLLVVGAGGGREVIALSRRGYDVSGYECNPVLASAAATRVSIHAPGATVHPIQPDAAPPPGRTWDGLIVGWSAYMLIPGRAARVRFLRSLALLGRPGTPLLLSFFTRRAVDPHARRIAAIGTPLRRLRGAEPVRPGDDLAPNHIHRFTVDELRDEMQDGGFEMLSFTPQGPGRTESGWAIGRVRPS